MIEIKNKYTGEVMHTVDADSLKGADLRGLILIGADLREANLRQAKLSGANLAEANLPAADLTEADLRQADFRQANLAAADLLKANLRQTDLREADLAYADLRLSDLTGATLAEADLRKTKLSGANPYKAKILYNWNSSCITTSYPVYHQSLVGSAGRDITWFPEQDVLFIGCFKGSLKGGIAAIDKKYPLDHRINKEYKAIIAHFQNLHNIRSC